MAVQKQPRFPAVRSDVAAATGPCGHAQVEIYGGRSLICPNCPCRGSPPNLPADSGKIWAAKGAKLYPNSTLIARLFELRNTRARREVRGGGVTRYSGLMAITTEE